jgi:hypothetical protein
MHKLPHDQRETTLRTFVKHTLLNILALSKINESLDKCETADDVLTQRMKLFARLALQNTNNDVRVSRVGDMGIRLGEGRKLAHPPLRRAAPRAAESPYLRLRGPAAPQPA